MVTREENVDRVAEYESFYTGTRQIGGTVLTQGATTSTGRPIPVPISGQSYITPEGYTVPYATSPYDVAFIVDGEVVVKTLTPTEYDMLQSGELTPREVLEQRSIISEHVTAETPIQQPAPSYYIPPAPSYYIPPQPNPFQSRYAELGSLEGVKTAVPPPYSAGQTTAEVVEAPQEFTITSRPTPFFTVTEKVPLTMRSRYDDWRETEGFFLQEPPERYYLSKALTGAAEFTGYGQEPLPEVINVTGVFGSTDTQAREFVRVPQPYYNLRGTVTETAEGFIPETTLPLGTWISTTGREGQAFSYGAITSLLDVPALLTGAAPKIYQVSGREKAAEIAGSLYGDYLTGKAIGAGLEIALPKKYETQVLIGVRKYEEATQIEPNLLYRVSGKEYESMVEPIYMKFTADKLEYVFPEQLKGSYFIEDFKAPIIPKDRMTPAISETYFKVGKFTWNTEKGFSYTTLKEGLKQDELILLDRGRFSLDKTLDMSGVLGYTTVRELEGGSKIVPSKRIYMKTDYFGDLTEVYSPKLNKFITLPADADNILRHEVIHIIQPYASEKEVIKMTGLSRKLPAGISGEQIWPAAVKLKAKTTYLDLQGIYPDLDYPTIDIQDTIIKIQRSGKGQSTVLYDLAQSYKAQLADISGAKVGKIKVPSGSIKVGGESIELSTTKMLKSRILDAPPVWAAGSGGASLYAEEEYYINTEIAKDYEIKREGLKITGTGLLGGQRSIQFTGLKKRPEYEKLQLSGQLAANRQKRITIQSQRSDTEQMKISDLVQRQGQKQKVTPKLALAQATRLTTTPYTYTPHAPVVKLPASWSGAAKKKTVRRGRPSLKLGNIRIKPRSRSPRSDPLSVEISAGELYRKGKAPLPRLLGGKKAWKYFKGSAGLRVPTVEMIRKPVKKGKKVRKKSKKRGWDRWY